MTNSTDRQGLLLLAGLSTIAFIAFLSPMRSVLVWAVALAVIFGPRNEKLAQKFGSRNLASGVSVLIAVITLMLPVTLIAYFSREQFALMVAGMSGFAEQLPQHINHAEASLSNTFGLNIKVGTANEHEIAGRLKVLQESLSEQMLRFGGAAVNQIIELISTLYILFFFLRDWRAILRFMSSLIPLKPVHKASLTAGLVSVVNATLRGTIIVAAVQAGVAGLFYLVLGVKVWALLAAVTFIFCLMPAIGSGAVWIPVALYFLFSGEIMHFWIMVIGGTLVIGMIDNFLRPSLIGKETALPEFIIFLMTFGGLLLMGIDGLLLGPIVAKLFIEIWEMYIAEVAEQEQQDSKAAD